MSRTETFAGLIETICHVHSELTVQVNRAVNAGWTLRNWLIGFYCFEARHKRAKVTIRNFLAVHVVRVGWVEQRETQRQGLTMLGFIAFNPAYDLLIPAGIAGIQVTRMRGLGFMPSVASGFRQSLPERRLGAAETGCEISGLSAIQGQRRGVAGGCTGGLGC